MVTRKTLVRTAGLLVALAAAPAISSAQQPHTIYDDVKLEVVPDNNGVDPYPGEMVLLRIRGTYRPQVNREKLIAPDLVNFGWMNLLRDKNFDSNFGNFPARGFERTIAIFPEKSGMSTIGSFIHKLYVVDSEGYGGSREIEVKSKPIQLNIAKWNGPGGPDDASQWWLPSSDVRITDEWSGDPNRVPRGQTVRRTVTIEADGVSAEQLPPPPIMASAGIISFRGPNERETRVTEQGPIARAIYRWDMRPISAFPATMEPIKIPWFDTVARTMREAVIPAQRMAWAIAPGAAGEQVQANAPRASSAALIASGIVAFAIGAGVLLVGAKSDGGLPKLPPRALWRLRVARWRRDAPAFRAAVTELARHDGERAGQWLGASEVHGGLAELDRHLYYPGKAPMPDLGALAKVILAARKKAVTGMRRAASSLAPLDGPYRRA